MKMFHGDFQTNLEDFCSLLKITFHNEKHHLIIYLLKWEKSNKQEKQTALISVAFSLFSCFNVEEKSKLAVTLMNKPLQTETDVLNFSTVGKVFLFQHVQNFTFTTSLFRNVLKEFKPTS